MKPSVTIVIPVYAAEEFIDETLASASAQSFRDYKALLSIDPAGDDTESVCRKFARGDRRFDVRVNRRRLGWVGNFNRAMSLVRTPYFVFLPHDDVLPARYVEALKETLDAHPEAIATYPDVERFENASSVSTLDSLVGTPVQRVTQFLGGALNAIPFRGLVRTRALDDGLVLMDGRFGGFFSDTLWVTELALMGDCIRVPGVMYAKRVRAGSIVREWESWPDAKKADAWLDHLSLVVAALARSGMSRDDQAAAVGAALGRLADVPPRWRPFADDADRHRFVARLLVEVARGDS